MSVCKNHTLLYHTTMYRCIFIQNRQYINTPKSCIVTPLYTVQDTYDSTYLRKVAQCPLLTVDQVLTGHSAETKEVRVEYLDKDDFGRKARRFHVMDDLKVE